MNDGAPLAVELYNTIRAAAGQLVDALEDERGLALWLATIDDRLPVDSAAVDSGRLAEFLRLREAVRDVLAGCIAGRAPRAATAELLNRSSATGAGHPVLRGGGAQWRFCSTDPTDIVLGVLAADTIELAGGPRAPQLRSCDAPGCVLVFLKDHPRREWCSASCGNRARQARHYARTRPPT